MKTNLLLTLSILYTISIFAQFGEQQIISTTTVKPYLSIPFDIDNDGYMDILTASGETNKLSWYRNLDGAGNFGSEIVIDGATAYFLSVEFADIDGDGDKDILYVKNNPRQMAWLENLDGIGSFSTEQIIKEQDFISSVIHKDFDNDGDKDLIAIVNTSSNGRIVWYENLDGQGTFGNENVLVQNNALFTKVLIEDIDNDGNLDILATESVLGGGSIFWYKNLGNTIYGGAQIIYQFQYLQSGGTNIIDFRYVDINADGKKDLVITANEEGGAINTYWFENIDNLGNFGSIQFIADLGFNYLFYDLDNDSNLDILYWNTPGRSIFWKENEDGLGTYGTHQPITSDAINIRDSNAADLDGDGWPDILSASRDDNKLAWYKNNILGVPTSKYSNYFIYPNPTNGLLHIESKLPIFKISVFDILGQKFGTYKNTNQIDLFNVDRGVYFVNFEDENGDSRTHKIVKE